MKHLIGLLAAALIAATPVAAAEVGGRYRAQGTNFDGSPYMSEVEIAITSGTTCAITWVTGASQSSGICMRNGDSFAAAYQLGDKVGLIIYRMMPDGSMNGLWTLAGVDGNGTEVLIPAQ